MKSIAKWSSRERSIPTDFDQPYHTTFCAGDLRKFIEGLPDSAVLFMDGGSDSDDGHWLTKYTRGPTDRSERAGLVLAIVGYRERRAAHRQMQRMLADNTQRLGRINRQINDLTDTINKINKLSLPAQAKAAVDYMEARKKLDYHAREKIVIEGRIDKDKTNCIDRERELERRMGYLRQQYRQIHFPFNQE